jgi:hypothetical protein
MLKGVKVSIGKDDNCFEKFSNTWTESLLKIIVNRCATVIYLNRGLPNDGRKIYRFSQHRVS